jgi:membrane protein DedA with SNARE-associated domain
MLVAATLAADRGDLRLPVVVVLAIGSMIMGSQIGFCLGRWGGRALLRRLPLATERMAMIEAQHARWGHWLVLTAPFIDGVRQLAALTAGMLGMRWWLFTATNLVAAILWAAAWIGATLLVEEHVGAILPFLHTAKPWLLLAALLAVVGMALYLRRRGEPPGTASR